jgi:hypothetical protein
MLYLGEYNHVSFFPPSLLRRVTELGNRNVLVLVLSDHLRSPEDDAREHDRPRLSHGCNTVVDVLRRVSGEDVFDDQDSLRTEARKGELASHTKKAKPERIQAENLEATISTGYLGLITSQQSRCVQLSQPDLPPIERTP